ncbi:acyltransferase family protein [Allonocardiopsis opalescens]|uniref:Fucose 4-O-acetylase-like acetyltransferase n=1 Tax=Allonocardiopsis opalescens TaxID=1144618 RepID=A0A2T0Q4T9_9ACTN|nr:acyltransferase family protein [Allonocardiopsis opalescens]PRX98721.1 fucose 4-O-acetylase-like acetyltransferase [Allonocardiopsis opalescens]
MTAERTRPAPAPPPAAGAAPRRRLRYVDNLRVALTVLVVLHHVAITYGNLPVWYYHEPPADPSGTALDVFVLLNQSFFMGFFFLVSGYFVPGSLDRRGAGPFMRERLLRLGVPLLAFLILLRPLATLGLYLGLPDRAETPYWLFFLVSWDPGPLWFVEVLLVFSAVYALWHRFGRRRGADAAAGRGRAPRLLGLLGLLAVLTVATVLWRQLVPAGSMWPVVGLPTPYFLPQYAVLFAVGVLAYRKGWAEALPVRLGWAGLAGALAGVPLLIGATLYALATAGTGDQVGSALVAFGENLIAVGMVAALTVLFRARFDRQGPLGAFLSANAYAVYVLHALVVVGAGYALSWWEAPAVVKFAAASAISVPLCFAAAQAVRMLPGARRVL